MNGDSRGIHPGHRPAVDPSTTDQHNVARARVNAMDRQRRLARWAERHMSMVQHYGPQPLRAVPLAQYLAEGRWAA